MHPIAILSFDRPQYLDAVLISLKAQTKPIDRIILFQDGPKSASTNHCVQLFQTQFPQGVVRQSAVNLGVARNFDRAERYMFEELNTEAAYFFEDDMILSPHYLAMLDRLTDFALAEDKVAYVAAYGKRQSKLVEQRVHQNEIIRMDNKWGFALTRRQWTAQRGILAAYLDIVALCDYQYRDNQAIWAYHQTLGYGAGTSQDGMKDVASCLLGTTKIMTHACFGRYIGAIGANGTQQFYDEEGFAATELYPEDITLLNFPTRRQLDDWIEADRIAGRLFLTK
jgi:hypothetical protein